MPPETTAGGRAVPGRRHFNLAGATLVALVIALAAPAAGFADSYTFTPVADTYTRSDLPTTNFGDGHRLTARDHPRQERNTYLRFNVEVPAGETVTGATLRMYATSDGRSIDLHGLADDRWDEDTLVWDSAPEHTAASVAHVDDVAVDSAFSLDASELVSGRGLVSMVLTSEANSMVRLVSRENDSYRPRLIVETSATGTSPDPGTDPAPEPTPDPGTNPLPIPDPLVGPWAWDARSAALDPNNAALAQRVIANVRTPNLAMTDWAVATADAKAGDPEYAIPRTDQGGSITVRIPLGTRPDPSGDGHLTVRDLERGIETDFWQARYDSLTQRISTTSAAISFPLGAVSAGSGWAGNAANTPLRRGLITGEDMKAAIDTNTGLPYTLQFGLPNIAQGSPRWPAVHNVPTGDYSSVVEGTWVRLDPTFDVEDSGLPAWQKVIARTLQIRGAVNRDNSGTFSIYGRNPLNGEAPWSVAGMSGSSAGFSSAFPWNRLQVLAAPAG